MYFWGYLADMRSKFNEVIRIHVISLSNFFTSLKKVALADQRWVELFFFFKLPDRLYLYFGRAVVNNAGMFVP